MHMELNYEKKNNFLKTKVFMSKPSFAGIMKVFHFRTSFLSGRNSAFTWLYCIRLSGLFLRLVSIKMYLLGYSHIIYF